MKISTDGWLFVIATSLGAIGLISLLICAVQFLLNGAVTFVFY